MKTKLITLSALFLIGLCGPMRSQIAFYDAQFLARYSAEDIEQIIKWGKGDTAARSDELESNQKQLNRLNKELENEKDSSAKATIRASITKLQATIVQLEAQSKTPRLPNSERNAAQNVKNFLAQPFGAPFNVHDVELFKSAVVKYNNWSSSSGAEKDRQEFHAFSPGVLSLLSAIPGLLSGSSGGIAPDLQSKILDGLGTYFAEEFRKGRMLAFQQAFEKTFGQVGEFQVLFPETYEQIRRSDPLEFPEMGDDLKKTIASDFMNLLDNLIAHIDQNQADQINGAPLRILNRSNCSNIKDSQPYVYLSFGADVAARLINRMPLQDLFPYLDHKYYDSTFAGVPAGANEARVVLGDLSRMINLLQGAIRYQSKEDEKGNQRIWIALEDFRQLDNHTEVTLFVALIYQQDRRLFDKLQKKWLGRSLRSDDQATELVARLPALIKRVQHLLSDIQVAAESGKENSADFVRMMGHAMGLLQTLDKELKFEVFKDKKLLLFRASIRIYQAFVEEDFDNLTEHVVEILDVLFETSGAKEEDLTKVINCLLKYSEFMESVVEAEDNQEMAELIRRHAAEPSSYLLKRNHPFTLSLSGHPGIYLGGETRNDKVSGGFTAGITAPIGLEATLGLVKKRSETKLYDNKSSGSIGIYAQVLDIGAIMNYRTGDSTSALPDTVTFRQVFSPGLSLNYGFPNSGITLGAGWQYSPELRKINAETGSELRAPTNRFFIRMSWDLPLLNIAKRDRTKVHW